MTTITHCPLCGYGPLADRYADAQELRWSYDICPCCGCEFGYDDNLRHLEKWIEGGMKWFNQDLCSTTWSYEEQIQNQIRPWPPRGIQQDAQPDAVGAG